MTLPRLVLVLPPGASLPVLSPFQTLSFAAHVLILAALVLGPSLRNRRPLASDAIVVDIVGGLPGPPAPKAGVALPVQQPPKEKAPAKEGVRTTSKPVVPPDPSKLKEPKPKKKKEDPPPKPDDAEDEQAPAPSPTPPSEAPAGGAGGSGSAPVPGPGGITSLDGADLEFAWYRAQVTSTLRGRWVRPILEDASGPIAATVVFDIRRDGSVTGVQIETSSGVAVMDRSVLRAVLESAPLPALPAGFREPVLAARYEFRFQPEEP